MNDQQTADQIAVCPDCGRSPCIKAYYCNVAPNEGVPMHWLAVEAVVRSVTKRVAQGDCPTEPPQSREVLEEVICELYKARLRRRIAAAPDDEPAAGGEFSP